MPVSREESGGVQGLRAWVSDAVGRVRGQLPGMGGGPVSRQACEASVAELEQLARLLENEEDLRGSVQVWLAGALTLREAVGQGSAADRERAERLLREARDRTTTLGAVVTEEDQRWAALFLVLRLSPIQPQQGLSAAPDLSRYLDALQREGLPAMMAKAVELSALLDEVVELPLPPQLLGPLRRAQGFYTSPSPQGMSELLADMMPAGSPFADQLRRMMDQMFGATAAQGPHSDASTQPVWERDTDQDPEPEPQPEPDPDPEPQRQELTLEGVRNLAGALDAVNAAGEGFEAVLGTGDPKALNELLGRLRSAQDLPLPEGLDAAPALEAIRASLLAVSPAVGGTHQDVAAGRAHMDALVGHLARLRGELPVGVGDPAVLGRAMDISTRAVTAREAENATALHALVAEAEALGAAVTEDDPLRFAVDVAIGTALASLGIVTRDKETLLRALPYIERGATQAGESDLPFAVELPQPWAQDIGMSRAALAGETPPPGPERVPPPPDASMEDRYSFALSLGVRFDVHRDPATLDAMIDELEQLRVGVREGKAPRIAADALWQLTEAYHLRAQLTGNASDPVGEATVTAAEQALTALAADVLLQAGAEHGLLAARAGASRGIRAARMAGSYGRLHEVLAALELGRALVLQAASTTSAVPELLEAAGREDLAEAWRAASGAAGGTGGPGEVPGLLPSTVRREALETLGYREKGGLLGIPTMDKLSDGLAEAGADAIVYLVAGDEQGPGLTITIGPKLGAGAGSLPLLTDVEGGPLARYVDAAAARDLSLNDPDAAQAWEEALEELCDWAYQVVGRALGEIAERLRTVDEARGDRPPRIVLVPCGRLGIVPWHAARLPASGEHERLCQAMVISYAASGGQFLRTVRRAPREPVAAPVLVVDPLMELGYADLEANALRDVFYPHARVHGALYGEELPPGTPESVLGFMADGTSVLHLVSHGSAGPQPTESAVELAADSDGTRARLTVARILDREGQQESSEGPLVVLSACQTDLGKRDHDEALTLTTAFIAAGARNVVGSRWLAQDSGTALLMAVFHHHLVVDGLSPVDALRAAQSWMLDPHRENPGSLRGDLLREAERPGLDRTALWATFIHQGHPGPNATDTGEPTT